MKFALAEINVVFISDDTAGNKVSVWLLAVSTGEPWSAIVLLHYCYIYLICDTCDKKHPLKGAQVLSLLYVIDA